jgi:secondary thiamine-phosphate synthase enzyme
MTVESGSVSFHTHLEGEILDITEKIQAFVTNGRIKNGVVFLFVPGSTAALTTIEFEPGLVADFPKILERVAPKTGSYEHEKQWHDGNGHSHVRASLIGPDLSVPVRERKLVLGTWQQIVFIELDVRPRERMVVVQLIGD